METMQPNSSPNLAKFKVDLHDLGTHWDCHFLPEGGPSPVSVVVICACITAGFMLRDFVGVLPAWGWGCPHRHRIGDLPEVGR